jgi:hypothetical protein
MRTGTRRSENARNFHRAAALYCIDMTDSSVRKSLENLLPPLLIGLVVLVFWNSFFVYPLKIFVVFLHELSHGLAAIATGGSIERVTLSPYQGGMCYTRGGSTFLILNAGYLGSLLWGVLLLLLSARTSWNRGVLIGLGALTVLVTLLYVRSLFGFLYGLVAGAAMILAGRKLSAAVCALIARVVAVTSCLYAVWDIASDVLLRSEPSSDANALARLTGIPGILWGILWIVAALVLTGWGLVRIARTGAARP